MSAIANRADLRSGGDVAAAGMPASQSTRPRQRYRANPLRPVERPINAPANASSYSRLAASKASSAPASSAAPAAAAASSSAPQAAAAPVGGADPTTLPRGKVTDVYRREENGVRKTTIKIALSSGEERSVTDSGVELVSISGEVSTGDSVSLVPTGPAAFQWQREADPTLASAASKPRKRRRVFTVDDLIGEKGVARIVQSFPRMRWRGLGYEADDLHRLMFAYKLWANEMFPHLNFLVLIKAIESMGATRRVQRYLDAFRFGEQDADGKQQESSSMAAAAAAAVPAAAAAHEKEEQERRLYDDAAAAMLDDVYGDGASQAAEAAVSAASLPEATDAADAAALQESLRVMGLLPPAAEPSASAASAAVDADARARMEDNRRKAMEKRAAAAAKRRQQEEEQLQQQQSAAAASEDEPSPHRQEAAEAEQSGAAEDEAQHGLLSAAEEAEAPACAVSPADAEAAGEELQSLAELLVPETLEVEAEAQAESDPQCGTEAALSSAGDAALQLDVVPSSLSEADTDG